MGVLLAARFLDPNRLRRFLQRKAITGKGACLPLTVERRLPLGALDRVEYTLTLSDRRFRLSELWVASDATSIYVATSQPYQPGCLLPWINLEKALPELHARGRAVAAHPLA
jgi:hypothetical protein